MSKAFTVVAIGALALGLCGAPDARAEERFEIEQGTVLLRDDRTLIVDVEDGTEAGILAFDLGDDGFELLHAGEPFDVSKLNERCELVHFAVATSRPPAVYTREQVELRLASVVGESVDVEILRGSVVDRTTLELVVNIEEGSHRGLHKFIVDGDASLRIVRRGVPTEPSELQPGDDIAETRITTRRQPVLVTTWTAG